MVSVLPLLAIYGFQMPIPRTVVCIATWQFFHFQRLAKGARAFVQAPLFVATIC